MLWIKLRREIVQQTDATVAAPLLIMDALSHQHRNNQHFGLAAGKRFGGNTSIQPDTKIRSVRANLGAALHYILFAMGP